MSYPNEQMHTKTLPMCSLTYKTMGAHVLICIRRDWNEKGTSALHRQSACRRRHMNHTQLCGHDLLICTHGLERNELQLLLLMQQSRFLCTSIWQKFNMYFHYPSLRDILVCVRRTTAFYSIFFLPLLKRDVAAYIRTCHNCQP